MILVNEFTQDAFLKLVFVVPVIALGVGLSRQIKWLFLAVGIQLLLLITTLTTLVKLVNSGRYPGYTGMEGIALFVFPGMFLVSAAASFALYGISAWLISRRKKNQRNI